MDISLAALLLILNVVSLFDTMSIYHVPETDDSRALNIFFGFFKVLVMMFPLALLGIFTIVHKYQARRRLAEEKRQIEEEDEKEGEVDEEVMELLKVGEEVEDCRRRNRKMNIEGEL